MAKFNKRTNYRDKYPDLSEEVIEFLQQSDRKMEYQQYDLKTNRYRIDPANETVTYQPSREDSYERLMEENQQQFAADSEDVEEAALKALLIEKLRFCLKLLAPEEQEMIEELFFKNKSEHQLSAETGIPRMTLHDRKVKILDKLKKFMEK